MIAFPRLASMLVVLVAWGLPRPAIAADRSVYVGSFDKIRVQGPFDVRVVDGPPGATLAGDRGVIQGVQLVVNGTTLTIRNGIDQWGEQPRAATTQPVVVTLSTRNIVSATMIGAGRLTIPRMKATRVDLTVTGTGRIEAAGIDADQATATIIGGGAMALAGKAANARLLGNGPVAIDASGFVTGDLTVRVDGPGEIKANARYTANVNNVGLGQVTVAGKPKCVVKADAGGPVVCGGGS